VGLFDGVKKGLSQLAGEASKQADVARLNLDLDGLKAELANTEREAGRRARDMWAQGRLQDPELVELCQRMKSIEAQMLALQQQVEATKAAEAGQRTCPGCQRSVPKMGEFCPFCGAKLPICPQCLEPLSSEDRFCPHCGQKADQVP
jgi:RNA polymerase subunit RPABC4/transcription elongation factor Spt4